MPSKKARSSRSPVSQFIAEGEVITAEEWLTVANCFKLSSREWSVLILTCQCLPHKAISKKLRLKPGTVDRYCQRLHGKLQVRDRVGLAVKALRFILELRGPAAN